MGYCADVLIRTFRLTKGSQAMPEGSVYRVIDVIGTSAESWEDATRVAVETASGSLRDLRVAEVVKLDVTIEEGKVALFRARLNLSFKFEKA